jgi:lysozyme family protein
VAKFELSIETILKHEGGYVNDPDDPGGETNFGISKRQYPKLDIAGLTIEQARVLYRQDYWKYDEIISQPVATKVFDMAVNMGHGRAHRILQEALQNVGEPVRIDGVLGPQTIKAANGSEYEELLKEIRVLMAVRYAQIALARPTSRKYLHNWMRRAFS